MSVSSELEMKHDMSNPSRERGVRVHLGSIVRKCRSTYERCVNDLSKGTAFCL